jgi:diaminohydroxyphosphoribosylaminopyrimidine deaminase / 5-amino-6-(5-phosphoribosylamino)uracil reductase
MQRCLELAALSQGYTAPNPMVGAVLVYGDRIIGEGRHQHYGQAHAEVNCFDSVAATDRHLVPMSTMYVSLEPCAHYGKTPPCALRIIKEGVKQVVICNPDPFASVDGRGIQQLAEAGVKVSSGVMAAAGEWLNRRFFTFHRQQRPYIILKWAQTADGMFTPADRSRLQLSDAFSQRLVHRWRTEEAAIIVGARTALRDNPRLQSRLWSGPQPLRIALDRNLSLPGTYHLLDDSSPTWMINNLKTEQLNNIRYIRMPQGPDLLPALLQELYRAGKLSLIVEGGMHLLEQFIAAGLWDEAPVFLKHPYLCPEACPHRDWVVRGKWQHSRSTMICLNYT